MNPACSFSRPLAALLVLATATLANGQATNAAPVLTTPEAVAPSVVRMLGALALVFALLLGGVWLVRNWQRFAVRRGLAPKLNVLEVKLLGGRQALYVIGYEQQRMLISTSPNGVALLTHLPTAENPPEGGSAPPPPPNFAQALLLAVGRKP